MGILYIVATPIGNMEDITIRAIRTLFTVDYIACEDTRHTGQLLASLKHLGGGRLSWQATDSREVNGIPKFISYYDEIEFKRVPEIIELLQDDKNVALVSDSGTPLISDPGFKLVRECIRRNIRIISIPGATSLITALTSSGLPPNNFLFLGYLPATQTKRKKLLTNLLQCFESLEQKPTVIFFESPHRLQDTLTNLKEVFGDIEIVIARELTKIHEEIWRGKISAASEKEETFKGEIILLINFF